MGDYKVDPEDRTLEMRVVSEREIHVRDNQKKALGSTMEPTSIQQVQPIAVTVTNEVVRVREVTNVVELVITNRPPAIPEAMPGRIGVAVWWFQDCDVDLYVSVAGHRELFFKNTNTVDGVYYRDIRHSNALNTEDAWKERWEYVEIRQEVNIEDLTCWLNVYKANRALTTPVAGKVRVQFGDGRISESTFEFTVNQGNGGVDRPTRETSPYWIQIDLRKAFRECGKLTALR
jgi:hypothetical protein